MALYHFHRVLVVASILLDAGFSWWCYSMYRQVGQGSYLTMMVLSSVVTLALIAYLFYFHRKTRRMQYAMSGVCVQCRADIRPVLLAGEDRCPRCGETLSSQMQRVAQASLSQA